MYYATAQTFISLIQGKKTIKKFLWIEENISVNHIAHVLGDRANIYFFNSKKKKQSRDFFESKKLFFDRIAKHKFVWFKEISFEAKKLFFVGVPFRSWKSKDKFVNQIHPIKIVKIRIFFGFWKNKKTDRDVQIFRSAKRDGRIILASEARDENVPTKRADFFFK